ncbi:MAG: hypothetical protein WD851_07290 [Pirellulales bacterium]
MTAIASAVEVESQFLTADFREYMTALVAAQPGIGKGWVKKSVAAAFTGTLGGPRR